MDPKNLPTLDPKLKEAYERVMNTTITSAPAQPSPAATGQPHQAPNITTAPAPSAPLTNNVTPQPLSTQPSSNALPHTTVAPSFNLNGPKSGNSSSQHTSTFVAGNQGSQGTKVSPVLLVAAGVVFFAVYTIFWLRFFNVPMPFLP